jgi:hypothetical protein
MPRRFGRPGVEMDPIYYLLGNGREWLNGGI